MLKNVLVVDEFGAIHFLSDTYEGRVHDKTSSRFSDILFLYNLKMEKNDV